MNCLLEAAASLWMGVRRRVVTEPPEEEVMTAHESLEQCRRNMEARERELLAVVSRLSDEALANKRAGDVLDTLHDALPMPAQAPRRHRRPVFLPPQFPYRFVPAVDSFLSCV